MTLDEMKALPEPQQKALFKRLDEVRGAGKSTNYACLPIDITEILTPTGWKKGDEIKNGDVVMSYNTTTRMNEWCTVKDVQKYPDAYVEMVGHQNWQMESTLDHRWHGRVRKTVGKNPSTHYYVDEILKTEEWKSDFVILNTAPFVGGESPVLPHEASLVAWVLADGYYKWSELSEKTSASSGARKGLIMSIAQASHKYQDEIREVLKENNIDFTEAPLKSLNENTMTSFVIPSAQARSFLDRIVGCRKQKHAVDWLKWVLQLSKESLKAFVHSFWLADGDSKGNFEKEHLVFKQNRGNIADALLVAGYLLGYNAKQIGGRCATIRFQKKRDYATCQRTRTISSRVTDVFCLTTENDSFVIRQNGMITITGNCQYGAGAATVARTAKVSAKVGKQLHTGYWKLNWSVNKIASETETKDTSFGTWQFNPISKLWYSLRTEKDRFSTLIQGTGAYVLDIWLYHCQKLALRRGLVFTLLGQFHDELILEVPDDQQDEYRALVADALGKVNDALKLNRELGCDINFGLRYSDIH